VARNWCETIRASQVIPVYPPTADLIPGDVFLVTSTVSEQADQYCDDGFLPLPFEVTRLNPVGYSAQYQKLNDNLLDDSKMPGVIARGNRGTNQESFHEAPTAAFPSYQFEVSNGGSFDLAVPISAVPLGVSFMGSTNAKGSITMRNVRTYGLNSLTLADQVNSWAANQGNREILRSFAASRGGKPVYLRVVSRVYLVKEFDVAIASARTNSGGASYGVGTPSELVMADAQLPKAGPSNQRRQETKSEENGAVPADSAGDSSGPEVAGNGTETSGTPGANTETADDPTEAAVPESRVANYNANVMNINKGLSANMQASTERIADEGSGLGAHVRFSSIASNAVSLQETLREHVVVGYLGFDMRIRDNGGLGMPIPTFAVLEDRAVPPSVEYVGAFTACQNDFNTIKDLLARMPYSDEVYDIAAASLQSDRALEQYQEETRRERAPVARDVAYSKLVRLLNPQGAERSAAQEEAWCYLAENLQAAWASVRSQNQSEGGN